MRDAISQLVSDALAAAIDAGELPLAEAPDPALERPRDPSHGDWATTVALRSREGRGHEPARGRRDRRGAHRGSRRTSTRSRSRARASSTSGCRPPRSSACSARRAGSGLDFGRSDAGAGKRVQVEFVSANPVGPMHVGHGRWAALGDSMARVLAHAGWSVEREFYINDAGVQMDIFAKSVAARYLELCGRDGHVRAGVVPGRLHRRDRARDLRGGGRRAGRSRPPASASRTSRRRRTSRCSSTSSTCCTGWAWTSTCGSRSARCTSRSQAARRRSSGRSRRCATAGYIYELDGALWFRSTDFGDDKDRVLVKADGDYTYFAADIAYHKNKFDRGFDRVINIWGADHHGYVARMKAAVAALGHEGQLDVVIGQLVNLFRNGEAVRMSKRTGEMVTFEELLDEVGADAARYWFLRRNTDQPVDFDIELARQQSADNPVFYVQYAHARICSILRKAAGDELAAPPRDRRGTLGRVRARRRGSLAARRARRARAHAQARRVLGGRRERGATISRRTGSLATPRTSPPASTSSTPCAAS